MTWAQAKTALVAKLAAVQISAPVSLTSSTVHETPPAVPQTSPCWVLFPPAVDVDRIPGQWREKRYRYRARLMVSDTDHAYAALIVENFVEATIDAFDDQDDLRTGGVQHVNGPRVAEPGIIRVPTPDGAVWHVADCTFEVQLGEARTFT